MLRLKIVKTLGGLANFNYMAVDEKKGNKFVFKLLNPEIQVLGCRSTDTQLANLVNEGVPGLNIPKAIWKCTNLYIGEFLEDSEPIIQKNISESREYIGKEKIL